MELMIPLRLWTDSTDDHWWFVQSLALQDPQTGQQGSKVKYQWTHKWLALLSIKPSILGASIICTHVHMLDDWKFHASPAISTVLKDSCSMTRSKTPTWDQGMSFSSILAMRAMLQKSTKFVVSKRLSHIKTSTLGCDIKMVLGQNPGFITST